MVTNLGKLHVWESCFHSTYGRTATLRYAETTYCVCGEQFYTKNNKPVPNAVKCYDWHKCKRLATVTGKILTVQ